MDRNQIICFPFRSPRDPLLFRLMHYYITEVISSHTVYNSEVACRDTNGRISVDTLDMFVDVSALLREKSGFTQYTNQCYTVDSRTPCLLIEIVDWEQVQKSS